VTDDLRAALQAALGPERFPREIERCGRLLTCVALSVLLLAPPASRGDESEVAAVIAKFKAKDPGLARVFASAAGYVVFPTVGKGGIGIGGARGKGWVYQRGRLIGRSTLTQVTIGLQLGGQAYSEVVFLKDRAALENFKLGRLKLDAQASAMAKGGLMYQASVGGQKFSFTPTGKAE
jgi:lipid-binding SYLF domain-containing protein